LTNCKYKYIFSENGGGKRAEINEFWSHIIVTIDNIIMDSYNSGQTKKTERRNCHCCPGIWEKRSVNENFYIYAYQVQHTEMKWT